MMKYLCFLPSVLCLLTPAPATALPPPEDLPEEILRTEIITEARSPIDGQPLTAAEYALYADKEYNVEARNFASLPGPDGSTIACPRSDFLPCPNYNPALPDQDRPFAATNHIINKFPIRDLLRQMFPF